MGGLRGFESQARPRHANRGFGVGDYANQCRRTAVQDLRAARSRKPPRRRINASIGRLRRPSPSSSRSWSVHLRGAAVGRRRVNVSSSTCPRLEPFPVGPRQRSGHAQRRRIAAAHRPIQNSIRNYGREGLGMWSSGRRPVTVSDSTIDDNGAPEIGTGGGSASATGAGGVARFDLAKRAAGRKHATTSSDRSTAIPERASRRRSAAAVQRRSNGIFVPAASNVTDDPRFPGQGRTQNGDRERRQARPCGSAHDDHSNRRSHPVRRAIIKLCKQQLDVNGAAGASLPAIRKPEADA